MSDQSRQSDAAIRHHEAAFAAAHREREPVWMQTLRGEAMASFRELGFPTTRLEDWRYTNVSRIADTLYEAATPATAIDPSALAALELPELGGALIIFVDGHYAPEHSKAISDGRALEGVSVRGIAESSLDDDPALAHWGSVGDWKSEAFAALNTAMAVDGAAIRIEAGSQQPQALHVLHLSSAGSDPPRISHPRALVVAGENSSATVILDFVSLGAGRSVTNGVVEVVVEANASLQLVVLQREGVERDHVSRSWIRQARDSRFALHTYSLGGSLVRNDVTAVLESEGAECELYGLYLGSGEQVIDNHTLVDHAAPHTTSRELYKGVIGDSARGVFRGRVIVRPDAQKTSAEQQNRNLLLSSKADVNTKPQLEIYADDVKCSHGSTIGQLDPDALFFLRSRGLAEAEARTLLTEGFANEVTEALPRGLLRDWVEALVLARLRASSEEGERR